MGHRGRQRQGRPSLEPTVDAVDQAGLVGEIRILHLDPGYGLRAVCRRLEALVEGDFDIQLRGTKGPGLNNQPVRPRLRWIVEATNSWVSNYGQLRRNADRPSRHRHVALCLATSMLIVGRLIDWRDRWSRD